MIGYLLVRAALRSRPRRAPPPRPSQNRGGNAAGELVFVFLLPWFIAGVHAGYEGHITLRLVADYSVAFLILLPAAVLVSIRVRWQRNRQVLEKYQPTPYADTSALMRARAAELNTREREERVLDLFSVPCPEPSCLAPVTVPCVMGAGIPVALVRRNPATFCHFTRMEAAVRYGTASPEDLRAQLSATRH